MPLQLRQQRLPAVRHLGFQAGPRRLIEQFDLAQVTHQHGITGLPVQGIAEGRATHDQVTEHTVITGAHGFAQVQAKVLVATQAQAVTQQLQVGAGGDALLALGQNRRLQLHQRQQGGRVEALTPEVIEQALQVGHRNRTGKRRGTGHADSKVDPRRQAVGNHPSRPRRPAKSPARREPRRIGKAPGGRYTPAQLLL